MAGLGHQRRPPDLREVDRAARAVSRLRASDTTAAPPCERAFAVARSAALRVGADPGEAARGHALGAARGGKRLQRRIEPARRRRGRSHRWRRRLAEPITPTSDQPSSLAMVTDHRLGARRARRRRRARCGCPSSAAPARARRRRRRARASAPSRPSSNWRAADRVAGRGRVVEHDQHRPRRAGEGGRDGAHAARELGAADPAGIEPLAVQREPLARPRAPRSRVPMRGGPAGIGQLHAGVPACQADARAGRSRRRAPTSALPDGDDAFGAARNLDRLRRRAPGPTSASASRRPPWPSSTTRVGAPLTARLRAPAVGRSVGVGVGQLEHHGLAGAPALRPAFAGAGARAPTASAVLKSASGAASGAPGARPSPSRRAPPRWAARLARDQGAALRPLRWSFMAGAVGQHQPCGDRAAALVRPPRPASAALTRQARSEPFTVVRALGATLRPTVAPESRPTATGASTKWS